MDKFFNIVSKEQPDINRFLFNIEINPQHYIFKGHFPSQPVVPGVFSLQIIKECYEQIIKTGLRYTFIKQCKFLEPVIPQANKILQVEITANKEKISATISQDGHLKLKLKATLPNIVVIIPTYNNEKTIAQIVKDCKQYADNIIVVNDGSTDKTDEILATLTRTTLNNIAIFRHTINKGKGFALKNALRYAAAHNYTHAITIDADGQHKASDIPKFLDTLEQNHNTLYIGARNLHAENMPGKNTFANKFSNFWIWAETGKRLQDTQSGFRLYPLEPLKKMRFITRRYDFEVEIMVRLSWKGFELKNIPIDVYYPSETERVSHFKPVKDFARISLLNTLLVLWAILIAYPLRFFRNK